MGPSRLTAAERSALQRLREDYCNTPFDPTAPDTDQALCEVWNTAFPEEPIESAADGQHWMRLGFQCTRPHTDVRSGRLALDQLHSLARNHPQQMRQLAVEAQQARYPFACACFNVTQLIAVFFDLYEFQAPSPVPCMARADREQLKHFAHLCCVTPQAGRIVLDELFRALVVIMHETWQEMHTRLAGSIDVMQFPQTLQAVAQENAAFWRWAHGNISDLLLLSKGQSSARQRNLSFPGGGLVLQSRKFALHKSLVPAACCLLPACFILPAGIP